jgi:translation initiation factor 4G
MERPADLPEMVMQRTEARSDRGRPGGGGGASGRRNSSQRNIESGGGGDQWARGSAAPPRRQSSQSDRPNAASPPDAWSRGQAPPKQQPPPSSGKGGRGGRGSYTSGNQYYDGPVEPLIKSENHWRPRKNTSAMVVAEKKVKAILNKMTKEKFDRLSEQMLEIPLLSYETLTMMINNVYEKAIDEPAFGDMYANLCVRLSQIASDNKFVHIIESDEEPPTDDGQVTATVDLSSNDDQTPRNKVYRWSHDVSTSDAEIVGPFASVDECLDAAFDEEERTPAARGDLELELVSVSIQRGIFIKIMKKTKLEEGEEDGFYVVYFPISEAEDCGQQISEIFLSEVECKSDAAKKNSFKRSLLNKCEEEFLKKDIYEAWQQEKQQYEERKSKLSDHERAEVESELEFRRLKIKKQMLGNVKFIGQLYKVNLLREKIMRFCVGSMLKLEEKATDAKAKNPEYIDSGNMDIDEEDHEAICNMFATIGSTIDKPPAAEFMKTCFQKIDRLIQDKNLPSRSRFMYKDLIDLRSNVWIPRRKEEKAKTIAEIRKDVEAEERKQAELSAQLHARGKSDPRSGGRGSYYDQRPSVTGGASNRPRSIKATTRTDDDGFMTVVGGRSAFPAPAIVSPIKAKDSMPAMKATNVPTPSVPSLSAEELNRRIKRMRTDYLGDGGNVQELLLSWDEIATTPDAGVELVKQSADRMLECKDDERAAIYKIIRELCERGKLTKADVQNGLAEAIEFVDSFVFDCPRIYEYLGSLIGDMLRIKMFDIPWLCDQCDKTKVEPETVAPASLMRFALLEWKKLSDSDVKLQVLQSERRLTELLGTDSRKSIMDAL